MPAAKPFNGYSSWNAWNVSLWINNDEPLYRMAQDYARRFTNRRVAARQFVRDLGTMRTPDGATYTISAVYGAMEDIL